MKGHAALAKSKPATVEVRDVGLGTLRAAGTYIGLMLQLEHPHDRAAILAEVMRELSIPLADIAAWYEGDGAR